jgi:tRNA A37 threonylcarbamoyladenosine dehydratase
MAEDMEIPAWMGRSRLLMGDDALHTLQRAHVLVAGLGGVGGIAAEMLVRSGVGELTIVDGDVVEASNRNRQIPALSSTHDLAKTEVMAQRLLDINPELKLHVKTLYLKEQLIPETLSETRYDYLLDCIDTLTPKVNLIYHALKLGIPVVSSMGAGGKIDPTALQVLDISKTKHCNLAKYVRKRLHRHGIYKGVTVVFSPEHADPKRIVLAPERSTKKSIIGTISYMPAVFGCTMASVAIRELTGLQRYEPGVPKKHHKLLKKKNPGT